MTKTISCCLFCQRELIIAKLALYVTGEETMAQWTHTHFTVYTFVARIRSNIL